MKAKPILTKDEQLAIITNEVRVKKELAARATKSKRKAVKGK